MVTGLNNVISHDDSMTYPQFANTAVVFDSIVMKACSTISTKTNATYRFQSTIEAPFMHNNLLLLLLPHYYSRPPRTGIVCIIDTCLNMIIVNDDFESNFNRMIASEAIHVNNYEVAINVAKLFVRLVMPYLSWEPQLFAEEVNKNYNEVANSRSEIGSLEPDFFKPMTECYNKGLKKQLTSEKWRTWVCRMNNHYLVKTTTIGIIDGKRRVLNWQVQVNEDGTVKVDMPKIVKQILKKKFPTEFP